MRKVDFLFWHWNKNRKWNYDISRMQWKAFSSREFAKQRVDSDRSSCLTEADRYVWNWMNVRPISCVKIWSYHSDIIARLQDSFWATGENDFKKAFLANTDWVHGIGKIEESLVVGLYCSGLCRLRARLSFGVGSAIACNPRRHNDEVWSNLEEIQGYYCYINIAFNFWKCAFGLHIHSVSWGGANRKTRIQLLISRCIIWPNRLENPGFFGRAGLNLKTSGNDTTPWY